MIIVLIGAFVHLLSNIFISLVTLLVLNLRNMCTCAKIIEYKTKPSTTTLWGWDDKLLTILLHVYSSTYHVALNSRL